MLKNLKIENYALIEHLDIDFTDGLSVITGETGAGKSIIIGALSLVLGHRADTKIILSDSGKCVVEAVFDISAYNLQHFFDQWELDYSDECIVRREVLPSGKSRAFINDTPVNLQQIKELISLLVDIHSQHENLLLSNADFQLNVVDTVADTSVELNQYRDIFDNYQTLRRQLKTLQSDAEKIIAERDYALFQFNQLKEAKLIDGEQDTLEEELKVMNHSQDITESLSTVSQIFDNDEIGVVSQLKTAANNIHRLGEYLGRADEFYERIDSAMIDIKDIAVEIDNILSNTEFSIERKNFVEDRLNMIYSLQQKHKAATVGELLDIQSDFEQKINLIDNFDEEIARLQRETADVESRLSEAAKQLTVKRMSVRKPVVEHVERMLNDLGMPNGRFEIVFSVLDGFAPSGADKIEFLFSANKNRPPLPISEIASGGEMSRLMLIVKSLISTTKALPTIIFDEIDTGISGEIAKKMGEIMEQMAENMQVIAISHLPQIASKGRTHYKVFKDETKDKTQTNIIQLSANERIMEIAEMMAGKNPSRLALDSAAEMLGSRL
ncbi:MAG: DNA repair protein RecN [Bacteroidota bacterium]